MIRWIEGMGILALSVMLTACGSSTAERWAEAKREIKGQPITVTSDGGSGLTVDRSNRRVSMGTLSTRPVTPQEIAKAKEDRQTLRFHGYTVDNPKKRAFDQERAKQTEIRQPNRFHGYNQNVQKNKRQNQSVRGYNRVNVYY